MVIPTLGLAIIAALFFLTKIPALKSVNVFNFMCGSGYLRNETFLFIEEINWPGMLMIGVIVVLASIIAEIVVSRKDF